MINSTGIIKMEGLVLSGCISLFIHYLKYANHQLRVVLSFLTKMLLRYSNSFRRKIRNNQNDWKAKLYFITNIHAVADQEKLGSTDLWKDIYFIAKKFKNNLVLTSLKSYILYLRKWLRSLVFMPVNFGGCQMTSLGCPYQEIQPFKNH